MLSLNEWGFTVVMFLVYHFVTSVMLFGLYGGELDETFFGISIAVALLVGGMTITSAVLFKTKAEYFGDYKLGFKEDTLSQYHYWFILGGRIVLACIIVALNSINYVGFICAAIPFASIIYLLVRRPYAKIYNNVRAVVNETIVLLTFGIYGFYRAIVDPVSQDTLSVVILPLAVIALLLICIVMNSALMFKYWWDKRVSTSEAKKDEEIAKLEPEMDTKFME